MDEVGYSKSILPKLFRATVDYSLSNPLIVVVLVFSIGIATVVAFGLSIAIPIYTSPGFGIASLLHFLGAVLFITTHKMIAGSVIVRTISPNNGGWIRSADSVLWRLVNIPLAVVTQGMIYALYLKNMISVYRGNLITLRSPEQPFGWPMTTLIPISVLIEKQSFPELISACEQRFTKQWASHDTAQVGFLPYLPVIVGFWFLFVVSAMVLPLVIGTPRSFFLALSICYAVTALGILPLPLIESMVYSHSRGWKLPSEFETVIADDMFYNPDAPGESKNRDQTPEKFAEPPYETTPAKGVDSELR